MIPVADTTTMSVVFAQRDISGNHTNHNIVSVDISPTSVAFAQRDNDDVDISTIGIDGDDISNDRIVTGLPYIDANPNPPNTLPVDTCQPALPELAPLTNISFEVGTGDETTKLTDAIETTTIPNHQVPTFEIYRQTFGV